MAGAAGPGSYVAPPRPGVPSLMPTAPNLATLPTAQNLPWAGAGGPGKSDVLSASTRRQSGATLGQVTGLGGSGWQAGRAAPPPKSAEANGKSWNPPPVAPASLKAAPGFDWSGTNLDFLSKTTPSLTAPSLGMDWLSNGLSAFGGKPAGEESDAITTAAPAAAPAMSGTMTAPVGKPAAANRGVTPPPRRCREGCHLRFNSGSSSRQHPSKQAQGIPNADATEESPLLLGICDGVSGCTKLGISPDILPRELLAACRSKSKQWLSTARAEDGQWLTEMMQDAFDSTKSLGATTILLASLRDSGCMSTVNIGDCSLLALRVVPAGQQPARLQVVYKTTPVRYEASKPVQLQRLPNVPDDRARNIMRNAKLDSCVLQPGDYVVLGSDGIFDNLTDEDIQQVLARHCQLGTTPTNDVLNAAAIGLVNTAIAGAQPDANAQPQQQQECLTTANPDDTTAIVATVVEVPNVDQYEQWFWRTHGTSQPPQEAARNDRNRSAPPAADRARARSLEPSGCTPAPLQDCTNTAGPVDDSTRFRNDPRSCQQTGSFKGKGGGKGNPAKGYGKGAAPQEGKGGKPAAPEWWQKMAVPGKVAMDAPPQRLATQAAQVGAADQVAEEAVGGGIARPRLTSTLLRAHEAKLATADSIARYSNVNRPGGQPAGPGWQQQQFQPQRKAATDDNCVIS